MKITALTLLIAACFPALHAQVTPSQNQQIKRLLGDGFTELPAQKKYPYSSFGQGVSIEPSATKKYDTTGLFTGNEYLLFRHPIAFVPRAEGLKLVGNAYVSVGEYQQFQQYIADSIARERIYHCLESDEDAAEFIHYKPGTTYTDYINKLHVVAIEDRSKNRELFPLDWSKSFDYEAQDYLPCLEDMYLPPAERFYHMKSIDERKLTYVFEDDYTGLADLPGEERMRILPGLINQPGKYRFQRYTNTFLNYCAWAKPSVHLRDPFFVMAQAYITTTGFRNMPVTGLTGAQARAFCYWKQSLLQRQCDDKHLNVRVIVTLPTLEDLQVPAPYGPVMTIPERDYTEQWRITAGAYGEFIAAVRDSILKEAFYDTVPMDETAMRMLDYRKLYFDNAALEWVNFDPSDRKHNRYYFYFRPGPLKVNSADRELAAKIRESDAYKHPVFRYYINDLHEKSIEGILAAWPDKYRNSERPPDTITLYTTTLNKRQDPLGRDKILDAYWDLTYQSTGVRSHENYQRFIYRREVPVLPELTKTLLPEELMTGISYEQAMAFYQWKYPIQNMRASDDWQQYVLPSEEQFNRVQSGERLVVKEQQIVFPSPVFRYVVHVYPE